MRTLSCILSAVLLTNVSYVTLSAHGQAVDRRRAVSKERQAYPSTYPTRLERPAGEPWRPQSGLVPPGVALGRAAVTRNGFVSVQVNVDAMGNNVPGDAANEPSLAVDPTNRSVMAIGWRQFDTVASDFRQAGVAYSRDAGQTWTFPGSLTPGVFGSDPVLASDAEGVFYYVSINFSDTRLFRSFDGGITWDDPPLLAAAGGLTDKEWMTIDRTGGPGHGHIYLSWTNGPQFVRSTDQGLTFDVTFDARPCVRLWGTLDVGPDGSLYAVDPCWNLVRSSDAQDATAPPSFEVVSTVPFTGGLDFGIPPNPAGLGGQIWVATDHSRGVRHGNLYVLASIGPPSIPAPDPLNVMFTRSSDGGCSWSEPVRIHDDIAGVETYQWFGTMAVAPNGRIDAVWNDTRFTGASHFSELHYAYSLDAGVTWSASTAVSPVFDSRIGWPMQNKLGDYYHMVSDNAGASLAYAATFNGEQDVYYLRIEAVDCNNNGTLDTDEIAAGTTPDCNANLIPDGCEADCNGSGLPDVCDVLNQSSTDCDANFVPDECDRDFDGDGAIDGCDDDVDNDGVPNADDVCDLTPPGTAVRQDGRSIADVDASCIIELIEYSRMRFCLDNSGPSRPSPNSICLTAYDDDRDNHIDLLDVATFQRVFGLNTKLK